MQEVSIDENAYIMATLPGNVDHDVPVIGFIAHFDTSPDFSGANVNPQIIHKYDGKDIVLNEKENIKKAWTFNSLPGSLATGPFYHGSDPVILTCKGKIFFQIADHFLFILIIEVNKVIHHLEDLLPVLIDFVNGLHKGFITPAKPQVKAITDRGNAQVLSRDRIGGIHQS